MPFRNLDSASFTPETLNIIYAAFDLAWAEISQEVGSDPTRAEFARNALAQSVLLATESEAKDPHALKDAALAAFAAKNRLHGGI